MRVYISTSEPNEKKKWTHTSESIKSLILNLEMIKLWNKECRWILVNTIKITRVQMYVCASVFECGYAWLQGLAKKDNYSYNWIIVVIKMSFVS